MSLNKNRFQNISWVEIFNKYIKQPKLNFFVKNYSSALIEALQENYNNVFESGISLSKSIPKIIHQISLDDESVPQHHKYYSKVLKDHHPEWEYKCWNINQILKLCSAEQKALIKDLKPKTKITFLKYVILKEKGGIFFDLSVKCLKSFDHLNNKCGLIISLVLPNSPQKVEVYGNIMGSTANHPIIVETLEKAHSNPTYEGLDSLFAEILKKYIKDGIFEDLLILPPNYLNPIDQASKIKEQTYDKSFLVVKNELMHPLNRIDLTSLACTIGIDKYSFIRVFDFALLSGIKHIKEADNYYKNRDDLKIFEAFKKMYINNHPSKLPFAKVENIPHNIHLIDAKEETVKVFKKAYNDWKISNWSVDELRLRLSNRGLGVIEDPVVEKFVMALLILFENGGVFLDNNTFPLQDITDFTYQYDLFAGLLPPDKKRLSVGLEIIGATQRNPIIEQTLDYLLDHFDYLNYVDCNNMFAYMISKSELQHKNIVFPPVFFYPVSKQSLNMNFLSKIVNKIYGSNYVIDLTKPTVESHFTDKNYIGSDQ